MHLKAFERQESGKIDIHIEMRNSRVLLNISIRCKN